MVAGRLPPVVAGIWRAAVGAGDTSGTSEYREALTDYLLGEPGPLQRLLGDLVPTVEHPSELGLTLAQRVSNRLRHLEQRLPNRMVADE